MSTERKQELERQLAAKEKELQEALDRVERLQKRETEHYETIGGLIGRMVHDINNLNSRIRASGCTLSHAFDDLRQHLPILCFDLAPELQRDFFAMLERAYQRQHQLIQRPSSREERRLRRALILTLEEHGLNDMEEVADILVDMGICKDDIEPFIPLLQSEQRISILQAGFSLMSLQDIDRWNLTPAHNRITQITYTLRNALLALLADNEIEDRITNRVENVVALYQYRMESQQIRVVKQYEEIPISRWYAGLDLVWMNLLENAIEAIDYQGIIEIAVSTQHPAPRTAHPAPRTPYIVIQITDSGRGIPEEIRNTIFDRSVTTKTNKDAHGAGLYLVRKIIEKHQGRVEVESQPGKTTFSVWLPLVQ